MKKKIFVVPHSHYDAAWQKTYEEYLDINFSNIYEVLEVLDRDKDFRFTLDQTALIEPFWERHPQHRSAFRKMVQEGRLELVCGMYIMPDVNMPSGESLVRQAQEGKKFLRETLGMDTNVGWMLDIFGQSPQMPQIMRRLGYEYYVFGRVMPEDSASEFIWRGLDGSQITCHWMPYHYSIFWRAPANLEDFKGFVDSRLEMLKPHSRLDYCLMLDGADFAPPEGWVAEMARQYNASQEQVEVIVATPSDFLKRLKDEQLPVVEGEFNTVFQGCYSARIEVKQGNRRSEVALLTAEGLGAVAEACRPSGTNVAEELRPAWKRVLLNQFHDVICGCHVDSVFKEAMADFQAAEKAAKESMAHSLSFCDAPARPRKDSLQTLWVFNPLAWDRTDVAEVQVSLVQGGVRDVHVETEEGKEVPCQLSEAKNHQSEGLKEFKLFFLASDVPGLGYRRYRLMAGKGKATKSPSLTWTWDEYKHFQEAKMTNGKVSLVVNGWTGMVTSLRLLQGGWEFISPENPLGNVIIRQEDRGDPWEYNAPCIGGATVTTFTPMPFPKPWQAKFSNENYGYSYMRGGPLFAEFSVRGVFGTGTRESRVRVYAHTSRIDFITSLVNQEEWVRYRAAFPTSLRVGRIVHEVPFGAIERPEGEFPAQTWMDYSDDEKGLALLNRGLPGNNVTDGVMMLSLLKCSPLKSGSGEGFELGKKHEFHYALYPHAGGWQEAAPPRLGAEYNFPLVVRSSEGGGPLPSSFSLLRAEPESLVVSSVANEGGKLRVRLYEAHGKRVAASLQLGQTIKSVRETNLLGQPSRKKVFFEGRQVKFHLSPFEIRQFQIEPE